MSTADEVLALIRRVDDTYRLFAHVIVPEEH